MSSASKLTLWPLTPATYQSPAQFAVYGDDAPRVPMPAYLIEHQDGLVLFDAGLDPDAVGDPVSGYGEVAERIRVRFDERNLLETQLRKRGHSLADVTTVIASHLHWDHIGGLKQFPNARIILGTGEQAYAGSPERFADAFYRPEDFSDEHGLRYDEIDDDLDIFGDGTVTALRLPGHTPGSLAALVRLEGRSFVLSGDVVHTRDAYEHEVHYHGDVDSMAARRSLRRLRSVIEEESAELWIVHDPEDWSRFTADLPQL
ncbi:N-acyl homoserine lactonase family protein [Microbacterium abyssi]|uniref:N-acyl homoserine lactonase family protein n=1 Tax=Microbacterium abyssi TaxID=2782166 RepID=UPI001887CF32|nr:N-acyl homoserine lactonase family protein [Microbacterium sp. A18JL241]